MTIRTDLTPIELQVLEVLELGMASRSGQTRSDRPAGIHTVQGTVANGLIEKGLARDVGGWNAVEITVEGRHIIQATPGTGGE